MKEHPDYKYRPRRRPKLMIRDIASEGHCLRLTSEIEHFFLGVE